VKIFVAAAASGGAQEDKERQDETQFTVPPKLVEKLVWVPVISLCTLFIPSYTFD